MKVHSILDIRAQVEVYYDPANPQVSVLKQGIRFSALLIATFGLWALIGCVVGLRRGFHSELESIGRSKTEAQLADKTLHIQDDYTPEAR